MILDNKPVMDFVIQYFLITDQLLKETKEQNKNTVSETQWTHKLHEVIRQLSQPSVQADKIRFAFIELAENIESELCQLHANGLYPDLTCGSGSKFKLLEHIESIHKEILLNPEDNVPHLSLMGNQRQWRDEGLLAFAIDQQKYLRSAKFNNLLDAVQCYEMQRFLLTQLFEYLNVTNNL